ncbi:MAG: histidinol-phosphate transaminase [Flaviflexus sp.]|nr:histidinol-phosphate transaminase [Flaviflexus sp.]
MSLFRPELHTLPAYVPGASSRDDDIIKLSSNELPFPALPAVTAAIAEGVGSLNRYPDMTASALAEQVAELHGVAPTQVVVGNGSVALIEKILDACCGPDSTVVMPWRSFEAYPIAITVAGATPIPVPLTPAGGLDLEAIIAAIEPSTRAVLVCTPNNPTGTALTHAEVEAFMERMPRDVLVLLDEAYVHFLTMADPVRGLDLLARYPQLVTLRTFSKAYGLAGLRIGYAVAEEQLAATLRSVMTPFGVNDLAQRAAAAALTERDKVMDRVGEVVRERERVLAALAETGWQVPETQANFVWFETEDTEGFLEAAARHKIRVRAFAGEGVRVSIAEPEGNDRLLALAAELRPR